MLTVPDAWLAVLGALRKPPRFFKNSVKPGGSSALEQCERRTAKNKNKQKNPPRFVPERGEMKVTM